MGKLSRVVERVGAVTVAVAAAVAVGVGTGACGFPPPPRVGPDEGGVCTAGAAVRCDGASLVRCNADGTGEVTEACALGCNAAATRCYDLDPSNGLASYLDLAAAEPDLDLGTTATIDTDTGAVMVDGKSAVVKSGLQTQTDAPMIRVFVVRSLKAVNVTISGHNAFAAVSHSDVQLDGVFSTQVASGWFSPGRWNDAVCQGGPLVSSGRSFSGAGGGGFGTPGGLGGGAVSPSATLLGGRAGGTAGTLALVPLRGGCDSGPIGVSDWGTGGGAIQLVSRTRVSITGVVAANGSHGSGGGSGGGVLIEAPVISVGGAIAANGAGGSGGCVLPPTGEDGRNDALPARPGLGCQTGGNGGGGAAGQTGAGPGLGASTTDDFTYVFGGHGGGGAGRIRLNAHAGAVSVSGLVSPNASRGEVSTR